MENPYPAYGIDVSGATMQECREIVVRLLHEIGFRTAHPEFLDRIRNRPGIRIDGERVHFDPALTQRYLDEFVAECLRARAERSAARPPSLNEREINLSHANTATRCRNVAPSSDRIVREKLRSWMEHGKLLKDRARDEALERIRTFVPRSLPQDQQKQLDGIYARAEAELADRVVG